MTSLIISKTKPLQDSGLKVALLTDGRMSGASGSVLSAIHLSPDTLGGGLVGRVEDGDMILIDAETGALELDVSGEELALRDPPGEGSEQSSYGMGRELFDVFRKNAGDTESGASVFGTDRS